MIPIPSGVRVWIATGYTDMRRGFPSLALQVQEVLKHDPLGGHLFWFIWPSAAGEAVTISPAQLSYLLSGIDWRNPQETLRPTRVG